MFGLTLEKLLVVGIIAALIIGPQRLPRYAVHLAVFARRMRDVLGEVKSRAEEESGLSAAEWASMDPRRYDPRRIIRDALEGSEIRTAIRDGSHVPFSDPDPEARGGDAATFVDTTRPSETVTRMDTGEVLTGSASERPAESLVPADSPAEEEPSADAPIAPAPTGHWVVAGTSGHPRRVWVDDALGAEEAEG